MVLVSPVICLTALKLNVPDIVLVTSFIDVMLSTPPAWSGEVPALEVKAVTSVRALSINAPALMELLSQARV